MADVCGEEAMFKSDELHGPSMGICEEELRQKLEVWMERAEQLHRQQLSIMTREILGDWNCCKADWFGRVPSPSMCSVISPPRVAQSSSRALSEISVISPTPETAMSEDFPRIRVHSDAVVHFRRHRRRQNEGKAPSRESSAAGHSDTERNPRAAAQLSAVIGSVMALPLRVRARQVHDETRKLGALQEAEMSDDRLFDRVSTPGSVGAEVGVQASSGSTTESASVNQNAPKALAPPTGNSMLFTYERSFQSSLPSEYKVLTRNIVGNIIYSKEFAVLNLLVLLVNLVFVGIRTDCRLGDQLVRMAVETSRCTCDRVAFWGEILCFTFFTLQLLLRVLLEGRLFVSGRGSSWNAFDLFIVTLTGVHFVFDRVPNLTLLLLFRAVHTATRIRRIERILRQVRVMFMVIRKGVPSFFSTLVVLAYVTYSLAVALAFRICRHLETLPPNDQAARALKDNFGTVLRTCFSIFGSVTGGHDWYDLLQILEGVDSSLAHMYLGYIAVIVVGVLNIVTGFFVDQAMQISQMDRDLRVKEQLELEESYAKELQKVFCEADVDKSGFLTKHEFESHLQDDRMSAYLSTLDLDVSEAQSLFNILDYRKSGEVSIDDFVWGCMRLKGAAKSADLCTLLYEHRQQKQTLAGYFEYLGQQLSLLHKSSTSCPSCGASSEGVSPGAIDANCGGHDAAASPSLDITDRMLHL